MIGKDDHHQIEPGPITAGYTVFQVTGEWQTSVMGSENTTWNALLREAGRRSCYAPAVLRGAQALGCTTRKQMPSQATGQSTLGLGVGESMPMTEARIQENALWESVQRT